MTTARLTYDSTNQIDFPYGVQKYTVTTQARDEPALCRLGSL
jgi:hypothetical protein